MSAEQKDIISTLYCRVCFLKFIFGLLFFLLIIILLTSSFSLVMLTFFRKSYVSGIATQLNKELQKFTKAGGAASKAGAAGTTAAKNYKGYTGSSITNSTGGDLWSIWFVSLLSCLFSATMIVFMYVFLYKKNIWKKNKSGTNKWNYFILFLGSALCGGLFYLRKFNPKMGGKLLGKAKFLTSTYIILPLFATIFTFCFFVWHFNNFVL